jgi:chromosome segregation ATPase
MKEKIKVYLPWITATVVVLLLIALVTVGLISSRGISANRASTKRLATELDSLNDEMGRAEVEVDKLKVEIDKADAEIDTLKAEIDKAVAERDRLREDLTEDISANADRLQEGAAYVAAKAEFQVLLLKASAKALKARIHLAEEEAGLAERDLAECDAALEAAMALADEKAKIALQEIRTSIVELKDSVEAHTFPLATLEIVSDKIDALIGK